MRVNGICYDTGTQTTGGSTTRPTLPIEVIEREVADIAGALHATAIRITGDDMGRIAQAATVAARHGLEVWLSPILPNADPATTLEAIEECARVAEKLRRGSTPATLVVGCELSVFMSGIMPGANHAARLALLADPARLMSEVAGAGLDPQAAFFDFLVTAARVARGLFGGALTYAAGSWEEVDWSGFDVVGVDAYRDAANRGSYVDGVLAQLRHGRPVVITEFGCATYRGAADAGGMGWNVIDRTSDAKLRAGIVRDEAAQANELADILDALEPSGVDGAFVYTYVAPSYPASLDPAHDLDTASYALVRSWPDGKTDAKAAYHAVAERYRK